MTTFDVHLRVLDKTNKAKFSHFQINNVPQFTLPEEFKLFLLENHQHIIAPARTTNFKFGYFVEGRGNRKFDIVDEQTLKQAYQEYSTFKRVCFWVDPHTPQSSETTRKAKRIKGKVFTSAINSRFSLS